MDKHALALVEPYAADFVTLLSACSNLSGSGIPEHGPDTGRRVTAWCSFRGYGGGQEDPRTLEKLQTT
jgi:hypothetical protein